VLENVRHLLFAEQLHTRRLFHEPPAWSPLGFTPETMRAARKLPPVSAGGPGLSEVWAGWDGVHAETVRRVAECPAPGTGDALDRNLRHLRAHISVIERLIRHWR
jgi:hypothetical protein